MKQRLQKRRKLATRAHFKKRKKKIETFPSCLPSFLLPSTDTPYARYHPLRCDFSSSWHPPPPHLSFWHHLSRLPIESLAFDIVLYYNIPQLHPPNTYTLYRQRKKKDNDAEIESSSVTHLHTFLSFPSLHVSNLDLIVTHKQEQLARKERNRENT
jgi:hypothetical protein